MLIPKVENMTSRNGNKIANQFVISINPQGMYNKSNGVYFQSYDSVIAVKRDGKIYLDTNKWDYSVTTGKYRNIFLGETKKETEAKIKSGEYKLVDLNN